MLKYSHTALVTFSGFVWLVIGVFLLQLGLNLVLSSVGLALWISPGQAPLQEALAPLFGGKEEVAVAIIALGLFVGYFKGRYVLGKVARKAVKRLEAYPNPTGLSSIYTPRYYLILAVMVALGFLIKYLEIPNDIRGGIDVAIGSALINGAFVYFRCALLLRSRDKMSEA